MKNANCFMTSLELILCPFLRRSTAARSWGKLQVPTVAAAHASIPWGILGQEGTVNVSEPDRVSRPRPVSFDMESTDPRVCAHSERDPRGLGPLGKGSWMVNIISGKAERMRGGLSDFQRIFQAPLGGPSGLYLGWCIPLRPQREVQARRPRWCREGGAAVTQVQSKIEGDSGRTFPDCVVAQRTTPITTQLALRPSSLGACP
ncbi:hypothetical protein Cadr_000005891 [Camelus dromedarius]|uniref:Uncharacterized protein n=1 Tax=Camelus dromedarius TaxID=9838 RepID=A0A5N4E374_CAMDR|nr:hypothetical protein Cadr_000005891 [Camelus dromedarius]